MQYFNSSFTFLHKFNLKKIPVFNSPYQNSRSVAELIIAEIISLARRLGDQNIKMHNGVWDKVSFFFLIQFWIFHPTAITFQRTRMQPIASKLEERFLESLAMAILAHNFRYSQKQWECKWFSTIPTTSCLSAIQGMCKLSIHQHFKQFITQKQFRLKLGSIVEKGWFCYLACPKYSTNARNDRRKGNPNDEKRWEQSTRAWFSAHLKQKKKNQRIVFVECEQRKCSCFARFGGCPKVWTFGGCCYWCLSSWTGK